MFDQENNLLQPPSKMEYFEVFELPQSFTLDEQSLANKFRQMQAKLHPDKFGTKSVIQKDYSEQWSALVNQAYQTLLKPLDRSLYLLELNGKPLEEEAIATDPEFLAEVMEINEQLDEIVDINKLDALKDDMRQIVDDFISKIEDAFSKGDVELAKENVTKMKYYCTILDKIDVKESKLLFS